MSPLCTPPGSLILTLSPAFRWSMPWITGTCGPTAALGGCASDFRLPLAISAGLKYSCVPSPSTICVIPVGVTAVTVPCLPCVNGYCGMSICTLSPTLKAGVEGGGAGGGAGGGGTAVGSVGDSFHGVALKAQPPSLKAMLLASIWLMTALPWFG